MVLKWSVDQYLWFDVTGSFCISICTNLGLRHPTNSSAFSFVVLWQLNLCNPSSSLNSSCFQQIVWWSFFFKQKISDFLLRKNSNIRTILSFYTISLYKPFFAVFSITTDLSGGFIHPDGCELVLVAVMRVPVVDDVDGVLDLHERDG